MKKTFFNSIFVLLTMIIIFSCKKEPGPGGKASIRGKVYIKNYATSSCDTIFQAAYYGQGENVYIMYGDEQGVGKVVKTSYDGSFIFDYLRTGKYKVYALSRDYASYLANCDGTQNEVLPVITEVNISNKKDNIELDDIVIFR